METQHIIRIDTVIKTLLTNKSPGPDGFITGFLPDVWRRTSKHLQFSHVTEREKVLLNSFCEASITLTPNRDKDPTKEETTGWYL